MKVKLLSSAFPGVEKMESQTFLWSLAGIDKYIHIVSLCVVCLILVSLGCPFPGPSLESAVFGVFIWIYLLAFLGC